MACVRARVVRHMLVCLSAGRVCLQPAAVFGERRQRRETLHPTPRPSTLDPSPTGGSET